MRLICGIDEVGRGALAGPLVVGAVVFPSFIKPIGGVDDSKLLTAKKRRELAEKIRLQAQAFAFGLITPQIIDCKGITYAFQAAARQAIRNLSLEPEFFLIDAFPLKYIPARKQKAIIKGDRQVYSIAAASIIAKVYRDMLMEKLGDTYPEYRWYNNKGYGTKIHRQAIRERGPSLHHRMSFLGKII